MIRFLVGRALVAFGEACVRGQAKLNALADHPVQRETQRRAVAGSAPPP